MIITSEVLGLYGQSSGLGEPETNDAVLSVPPLLLPTTKLYRPCTALHAGFLASGMATTSFFYSDRFTVTNGPAVDTITVVLGKGIWEISMSFAAIKNYASAQITDFTGMQISYDEGLTLASIWRTHVITASFEVSKTIAPFLVTSTGVVGTRVAFFTHMPVAGVGQSALIAIQMAGLRLV